MLTEEQAHFNKYHQLTRSPSERVNARLHAFHVIECRRFGRTTTRNFVRLVVLIDSMTTPPATEYLSPRFHSPEQPWRCDAEERDAIGAVLVANKDHIQWHGRASKKRSREKPGRKPVEMVYEASCPRCDRQLRLCTCPPPRPRGRPRKVAVAPPAPEAEISSRSSSTSSTSSTSSGSVSSTSTDSESASSTASSTVYRAARGRGAGRARGAKRTVAVAPTSKKKKCPSQSPPPRKPAGF
jgi:hypothetical protein